MDKTTTTFVYPVDDLYNRGGLLNMNKMVKNIEEEKKITFRNLRSC